jgi:hypothetical protein
MTTNLTTKKLTQQNLSLAKSLKANLEILNGMTMVTDQNGRIIDLNNTINPNGVGSASMTIWAAVYSLLMQFNSRGMGNFSVTSIGSTYTLNLPYYTTSTQTSTLQVFSMDLTYFFTQPAASVTNPTAINYVNWPVLSGSNGLTAASDHNYIAKLVLLSNEINNLHQFCELYADC